MGCGEGECSSFRPSTPRKHSITTPTFAHQHPEQTHDRRNRVALSAGHYCMNIWLCHDNQTAKSNAIVLFEAGARFSQEDEAGWKSLTHGVPGGESWNPSPEQEALAKPNDSAAQNNLGGMYENGRSEERGGGGEMVSQSC